MLIFLKNFVFGSKEKLHSTFIKWKLILFDTIAKPAVGEKTQTTSRYSVLLKQKVELGFCRCQEKWVFQPWAVLVKVLEDFRERLISRFVSQAYGVIPEIAKAFVCD